MAITTTTMINDAAELVKVKGQSQALSSAKQVKYLRRLNQMLQSWRNNGIDLGLDLMTSGETIYVDEADELAIFYNLAVMIAQDENKPILPDTKQMANDTKKSLRAKYFTQKDLDQEILLLGSSTSRILTGP